MVHQFFAGYFNQDWDMDADSTEGIVALYFADILPTECMQEVADEMTALVALDVTNETLGELLFRKYGCYYDPTPDGQTYRDWLKGLLRAFEAEIARRRALG